ncbi:MAG: ATP-binding cassette domain-containing protein [Anaerolineae bacterium]|nr:ATP-binding cassette domain-containing protein [Anaerolineae bacterium]
MTDTLSHDTTANIHPTLDAPIINRVPPLVVARNLTKYYGSIKAVDGVDVVAYPGEILGIVGESGSGKSTVLRLLNLEEATNGGVYNLQISGLTNTNLFELDRFDKRDVRVHHIGIVYQNPHLGLRMRYSASGNVAERLLITGERTFRTLRSKSNDSLLASEFPLDRVDDPPSVLSGGMQQRVQLAKAIALQPELLLLDEPTTGLDVSIQATVLDTLKRIQRLRTITMILVSHDLGVIRTLADRVMVMRNGRVVEQGLTDQILEDPQDPYTQQLVHAKL